MATVRTVTLPDGSTFTMGDWGDYPLHSRAEILAANAQDVTLFNFVVSQQIPGGASIARATLLDTNMPQASQLPLRHQMVIFSVAAIFDEAEANASGLVHTLANGGYQQNIIAEGIRKWQNIKCNVWGQLIVEGTKPFCEGELTRFPAGGGLWFYRSEEAFGTVTDSAYYVNNGEVGSHASRRLAMPIHLGSMESFAFILKYPRGAMGDWTDSQTGTPTDYGITIELRGARQRPIA